MIQFEGDEPFPGPPAEVAAKLSDAAFLVGCLPDATITTATPDRAAWSMHPKVALLTGELKAELDVTGREPRAVSFRIGTRAMGAGSSVRAVLDFLDAPAGGTTVKWKAELTEVTGLLRMVPRVVLQGAMQKVIAEAWPAIRGKMTG